MYIHTWVHKYLSGALCERKKIFYLKSPTWKIIRIFEVDNDLSFEKNGKVSESYLAFKTSAYLIIIIIISAQIIMLRKKLFNIS
jgi:hypothetical protein